MKMAFVKNVKTEFKKIKFAGPKEWKKDFPFFIAAFLATTLVVAVIDGAVSQAVTFVAGLL